MTGDELLAQFVVSTLAGIVVVFIDKAIGREGQGLAGYDPITSW
jgi:hypothetical protein